MELEGSRPATCVRIRVKPFYNSSLDINYGGGVDLGQVV